jgi:hypothetical protein
MGRSRFQGWLIALIGMIGGVTGWLWHQQPAVTGWRHGLFATLLICACINALHSWYRSPQGELCWDGQAWRWTSVGASVGGTVTAHLDFQNFLILSLRTMTGKRLWLWPERQTHVARWDDLRRAVFFKSSPIQVPDENADAELPQVSI